MRGAARTHPVSSALCSCSCQRRGVLLLEKIFAVSVVGCAEGKGAFLPASLQPHDTLDVLISLHGLDANFRQLDNFCKLMNFTLRFKLQLSEFDVIHNARILVFEQATLSK